MRIKISIVSVILNTHEPGHVRRAGSVLVEYALYVINSQYEQGWEQAQEGA
jgi:hypothetical protein